MLRSYKQVLLSTGIFALLSSLAFTAPAYAETPSDDAPQHCLPVGKALLPKYKRHIPLVELPKTFSQSRIVLLGEHHDNMDHHRWQLQLIAGLHTLKKNIALGFEMFPRSVQPVLDRWVAGEIDEKTLLKETNWSEYWRFDPKLYSALLNYARINQVPIYALNVNRKLVTKVAKQGWDNVADEDKEGVSKAAAPSRGYQELLADVFLRHGPGHGDKDREERLNEIIASDSFNNFMDGQQLWDRAMAEKIHDVVKDSPETTMIALSGSGHMMFGYGIPEQLKALNAPAPHVLIPWDTEFSCENIHTSEFADAVIGLGEPINTNEKTKSGRPKLGVYLDKDSTAGLVKITRVVEGSIAEESGIKEGDLIVSIAGKETQEVAKVIETVKSLSSGVWLPLIVKRGDEQLEIVAKFPAWEK